MNAEAKKRRRYRLRPSAKRLYTRLLIALIALLLAAFAIKMLFFRTSFSIKGYDVQKPFAISEGIKDAAKFKKPGDTVVGELSFLLDSSGKALEVSAVIYEPVSKSEVREWSLNIKGGSAKIKRMKGVKGEEAEKQNATLVDMPKLTRMFGTMEKLPLPALLKRVGLSEGQKLKATTENFSWPLNPEFSGHVTDGVTPIWVNGAGVISEIVKTYHPISDYIALDCSKISSAGEENPVLLLLAETA